MKNQYIDISPEKFQSIDFSKFKQVKRHSLTQKDIPFIAFMKMPHKERKEVTSGLYYKDGYLIEVISFRGKSAVTCQKLYKAQIEIYEAQ